jgi:acyl-CoA thioester hydrolase
MIQVPLDGEIRDGRHVMAVRVYYEDTDFTGIVYHANYLRFMERARTNYLRLIGADHRALYEEALAEAPGFAFVVRSMTIDFLKPARMDDVLLVTSFPEVVKGASLTMLQKVTRRRPAARGPCARRLRLRRPRAADPETPSPGDAGGSGADWGRGAVSLGEYFARGLFCGRSTPISRSRCKKLDQGS